MNKMLIVGIIVILFVSFVSAETDISLSRYHTYESISGQTTLPSGLTFNDDGTKMYIAHYSLTTGKIFQYNLTTPWDQSTSVLDYTYEDVTQGYKGFLGLNFNSNGTKIYSNMLGGNMFYMVLGTAWDLSSYTLNSSTNGHGGNSFYISSDGLHYYTVADGSITYYHLTTPWDFDSEDAIQVLDVSAQETDVYGLTFNDDGTFMFITGRDMDEVHQYELGTAWDLSDVTYLYNFDSLIDTFPTAISFNSNYTKFYILGDGSDRVRDYYTYQWIGDGRGLYNNPYIINNCSILQEIETVANFNKYFEVTNNIDCSDTINWNTGAGFYPIGDTYYFKGYFNGNNYTISDIYINRTTLGSYGLFAETFESYIYNLNLIGMTINTDDTKVALLTGTSEDSFYYNIYTEGIIYDPGIDELGGITAGSTSDFYYNTSTNLTVYNDDDVYYVGGISGYLTNGNIEYCKVNLNLNFYNASVTDYIGGISGYSDSSNISKCKVTIDVNSSEVVTELWEIGGFGGQWLQTSITDSHVDGVISYSNNSMNYIGGMLGYDDGNSLFNNSYTTLSYLGVNSSTVNCGVARTSSTILDGTYYNSENCDLNTTTTLTPLNNTEFMESSSFVDFDFTNTWMMVEEYSNPELIFYWEHQNTIVYKFYDMVTGQLINNTNMTITTDGGDIFYAENQTVNDSEFKIWDLPTGNYSLSVKGDGYEYSQYNLDLGEKDIIYLNMYLLDSELGATTTFRIRDENTGEPIYEADLEVYRRILGVAWIKVASYKSDIIGKIQLSYQPYKAYKFKALADGYVDQEFVINPITQSLYTVNMQRDQTLPITTIVVTPQNIDFYNDVPVNFSVTYISTDNEFDSYYMNLTYPGGNLTVNGAEPGGSILTGEVNITGAVIYDKIYISMVYYVDGVKYSKNIAKYIIITPGDYTFVKNRTNGWGLGLFERVLISTLIILVVSGIAMISIGTIGAGALGLIIAGYLWYIGMLPGLLAVMLIVGFLLISWRSSQ